MLRGEFLSGEADLAAKENGGWCLHELRHWLVYVVRQAIPITCLQQERNCHPDYPVPRHSSTASFNSVMSSSVRPVISLTQIGGIVHVWSI